MFLLEEIANDLRLSLAAMQVAAHTGHHLSTVGRAAFPQRCISSFSAGLPRHNHFKCAAVTSVCGGLPWIPFRHAFVQIDYLLMPSHN